MEFRNQCGRTSLKSANHLILDANRQTVAQRFRENWDQCATTLAVELSPEERAFFDPDVAKLKSAAYGTLEFTQAFKDLRGKVISFSAASVLR